MGSRFTSVVRSRSFVVLFTGLALAGCAQMGDIAPVVDGATRHDASLEAADGTADDGGPVALGRRHVGLRRCAACHQSADPGDGILSGSTMPIRGSSSGVIGYASNLTPDRDTGLGLWTDAQIASAIRGGIDAQGASMCVMPRYAEMTDTEVAAIVAYLRSLPAVAREIDESMCSWDMDAGTAVVDAWTDARADAVIHDASSVTDARRDGGTVSSRDVASALSECTAAWVINEV
ncbi:MAG: cytochrome c, partial [Deltaproteobacteria bacterium]